MTFLVAHVVIFFFVGITRFEIAMKPRFNSASTTMADSKQNAALEVVICEH